MKEKNQIIRTLFCFDQDLRLDDNAALEFAAAGASSLLCVYCHDQSRCEDDSFGTRRLGRLRKRFIEQSITGLSADLNRRGQRLLQVSGPVTTTIQHLIIEHRIEQVVRSRHFGCYENLKWKQLMQDNPLIDFIEIDSYTLFTREQIAGIGELPETFTKFRKRVELLPIAMPLGTTRLPLSPLSAEPVPAKTGDTEPVADLFAGGEAAAALHLEAYFAGRSPSRYKITRNAIDDWSSSSKMSPWLSAGCLSVRRLYQHLKNYEACNGSNESTYWLYFELLWREYSQWYALYYSERIFLPGGISGARPDSAFDDKRFARWCRGETDWPLVNACMRQLNQTGYISNRARQIVASALINELDLDWRCGAGYFEKQLIDYDVASNWSDWQYIAGVGADPRGGRHFNIEKQARQFDPDGSFVSRWLNPRSRDLIRASVETAAG